MDEGREGGEVGSFACERTAVSDSVSTSASRPYQCVKGRARTSLTTLTVPCPSPSSPPLRTPSRPRDLDRRLATLVLLVRRNEL